METYNNGVATELQNSALQLDMKTCFMEKNHLCQKTTYSYIIVFFQCVGCVILLNRE